VCTVCPTNSLSAEGSSTRAECVCLDGYGPTAAGECQLPVEVDEEEEEVKPCPDGYKGPNGGPCQPCDADDTTTGGGTTTATCAFAKNQDQCEAIEGCMALGGYRCESGGKYRFVSCVPEAVCAQVQTCASNDDNGKRTWFGTACVPVGYTVVDTTEDGTCCPTEECKDDGESKSVGNDCKSRKGGGCAVLEFRGDCPEGDAADKWLDKLKSDLVETTVRQVGCSPSAARERLDVTISDNNDGSNSFQCILRVSPPEDGEERVDAKEVAKGLQRERKQRKEERKEAKKKSGPSAHGFVAQSTDTTALPLSKFQSVVALSTFGTYETSTANGGGQRVSVSSLPILISTMIGVVAAFLRHW